MTIEEAMQRKLKAVLGHDRVYPDAVPDEQKTWPCLVYSHAGDDEQDGLSDATGKDHIDTFALEIWSPDRAAVVTQRNLLKAAFRGLNAQGVWGGDGGVVVAMAQCREAAADMSPADDGSDRHDRAERLSLRIFWYG